MEASDNSATTTSSNAGKGAGYWIGWIITGLVAAMLTMSGIMKLQGGPELEKGMEGLGLPEMMVRPLALIELTCVVVYVLPQSAVLGAILLTGYMGGAMCAHWRVDEPYLVQFGLGVAVWLGIALREPRLWQLIPLRRTSCCSKTTATATSES